jgi:hypothetical protein
MVKLNACWLCVCVPPMKYEMAYKVTYGKVSGNLQKSVDLGRSGKVSGNLQKFVDL